MVRQLMGLSLVVVCFGVSAAFAGVEKKTMSQYWAEVELPFLIQKSLAAPRLCASKLEYFLGCVHGVNALLEEAGEKTRLLPDSQIQGNALVVASVAGYDGAALVQVEAAPKETSVMAAVKRAKIERQADYQAWKKVFDEKAKTLDIDSIYTFVEATVVAHSKNESEVVAAGINLFLNTADDAHTRISPRQYYEDERSTSEVKFSGIGIQIRSVNDQLVVLAPIEGGPAHKAGVRSRDIITHIDGILLEKGTLEDLTKKIRGPKGTAVRLTVLRKDKVLEISVVRDDIVTKNVAWKVLPETRKKVGYLRLSDFMQGSPSGDLKAGLEALKAEGVESLVLDLRGNPGGLVDQAVKIANLFVGKDRTVVSQRDLRTRKVLSEEKTTDEASTDLPLVTLVDAGSASASEIVSGALQDWKRALVVGVRSFGKGSVQGVGEFSAAEGVLLIRTQATFHLPSGRSNQILGVVPDIEVYAQPNPTEEEKFSLREEDIYMNALPVSSEPFKTLQPEVVKSVTECVARTGRARQLYETEQDAALPPDYQLLYAQDVASCR